MAPNHIESLMMIISVQLIFIVVAARAIGALFQFIGQPQVCGEIAAGLALGPSVLGVLFPRLQQALFDPATAIHISILSQIGLVFTMFLVGLEFDFGHLRESRRTAAAISVAGLIVPFGLGLVLAPWIYSEMNLKVHPWGFTLFVATALSITALPVLGRIMIEFNLTKTRLGALTITAAAMDDAVGWLLLALVSAIVITKLQPFRLSLTALEVVAFLLLMIFAVRLLLLKWVRRVMRDSGGELPLNALAELIAFFLAAAAITNWIGIFSVFGAFVMGGILHDQVGFRTAVNRSLRDFVTVFFQPLFFTYTGLRTDIRALTSSRAWLICVVVILAASAGKFVACAAAARLSRLSWRESCSVGVMMNTRGLMELIVVNVGYDLGVIPKSVFFVLVMMALVTTYITAPVLSRLIRGTELQPSFDLSEFRQRRVRALRNVLAHWSGFSNEDESKKNADRLRAKESAGGAWKQWLAEISSARKRPIRSVLSP